MPQEDVLEYLAEQYPNKPTQREIAHALGKSLSTINEQVRSLCLQEKVFATGKGRKNRRYVASPLAAKELVAEVDRQKVRTDELEEQVGKLERMIEDLATGRVKYVPAPTTEEGGLKVTAP